MWEFFNFSLQHSLIECYSVFLLTTDHLLFSIFSTKIVVLSFHRSVCPIRCEMRDNIIADNSPPTQGNFAYHLVQLFVTIYSGLFTSVPSLPSGGRYSTTTWGLIWLVKCFSFVFFWLCRETWHWMWMCVCVCFSIHRRLLFRPEVVDIRQKTKRETLVTLNTFD